MESTQATAAPSSLGEDMDLPPGFRHTGILDSVTVGAPPVALAALAHSARVKADEDPLAAAQAAFPHLAEEQVRAALDLVDGQPGLGELRLSPWQALSLAVPSGLGVLLIALGVMLLVASTVSCLRDPAQAWWGLLLGPAWLVLGLGLERQAEWARKATVWLSVPGMLWVLAQIALGEPVPAWGALSICALGALCLHPLVHRWFTEGGRATSLALPVSAYRNGAACAALIVGALYFVVPAFGQMFKEVGVRMPLGTQLVVTLADVTRNYPLFVPLLTVLAPLPLLLVRKEHEPPLRLACRIASFVGLTSIAGWLGVPLLVLLNNL